MFIDLEGAMAGNTLGCIRLLLTICNSLGVSYFTLNKKSTTTVPTILTNAARLAIAAIFTVSEYYYIAVFDLNSTSQTLTFVYFVLKWILYLAKKKTTKDIILKVTG